MAPTPSSGEKTIPRHPISAADVLTVVAVVVLGAALKPAVSVTVYNLLVKPAPVAPLVPYRVTDVPLTVPVRPVTPVAVIDPFRLHALPEYAYF